LNNLVVSMLLLAILAGASVFFVSELSQMKIGNSYSNFSYNIIAYKFVNYSDQKTYFLIINYGYHEVYIDKIICVDLDNNTNHILISVKTTSYPQENLIIYHNEILNNYRCLLYGDNWFKNIVSLS